MEDTKKYNITKFTCYMFYILQAIVINLAPILLIPLKDEFGLSYTQLGVLISVNFIIQICSDFIFSRAVDKFGYRPFLLASSFFAIIGFLIFSFAPGMISPYLGLMIGTCIFSLAGGLLEIIISPLINDIPSSVEGRGMALLHSFYAWGQVAVVVFTTLFLYFAGDQYWRIITCLWLIVPVICLVFSVRIPIPSHLAISEQSSVLSVVKQPKFFLFLVMIFFGSCAENVMVQWSSAYFEKAISLPKIVGDIAGMSMFALMLGLSRVFSALMAKKIKLHDFMLLGVGVSCITYIIVSASTIPVISLVACGINGFMVGMLWPGTLVLAAKHFPKAGAWLFAYLALSGDLGGAFGSFFVGSISDNAPLWGITKWFGDLLNISIEQASLRLAMGISMLLPLIGFISLLVYKRMDNKENRPYTKG